MNTTASSSVLFSFNFCLLLLVTGCTFAQPPNFANLVVNPGFELDSDHDGFPDGWSLPRQMCKWDESILHSGKRSLRFTNHNPKVYQLITQPLAFVHGQRYRFCVWVKGEKVQDGDKWDDGAGVFMEWYSKEGKYLGGSFPSCLEGTFDWQQVIGQTEPIPSEASRVVVGLYLRPHNTGTAWFDDVMVTPVVEPLFTFFPTAPAYRGLLTSPTRGKWLRGEVEVNRRDYGLSGMVLAIKSCVVDENGLVRDDPREFPLPVLDKERMLALPLPDLPAGNYEWRVSLALPRQKPLAEVKTSLRVLSRRERQGMTYIDERGRTIVEGKPFFPLGLYLGPTEDEHLKRIASAGFNTILCYGYGVGPNPEAYLDRAHKYGLKVIYSIKDFYEGTQYFPKTGKSGLELAKDYVTRLRYHPALLAWYINDELPPTWVPKLNQMYELVTSLDPDHPTYQVLCDPPELPQYYGCTDVIGVDPYPIPRNPVTMTADWTAAAVKAMRSAKPVWVVPQIFGWHNYTGKPEDRDPTFDERRCMFYLALIHGAKGLIAYSYFDLLCTTRRKPAPPDLFLKRWEEVSKLGLEVNQLLPILLNGTDASEGAQKVANGRVHLRALKMKRRLYLLATNTAAEPLSFRWRLPDGNWKSVDALFEAPPTKLENGELQAQLAPLQATTWVIR